MHLSFPVGRLAGCGLAVLLATAALLAPNDGRAADGGMGAATATGETIRLSRRSPAYSQVTFATPPLNIVGPAEVRPLSEFLDEVEADHQAIIDTKHMVDVATLPPLEEIRFGRDAFIVSVQRPAAQVRVGALVARGLQKPAGPEDHLNERTADYREPQP